MYSRVQKSAHAHQICCHWPGEPACLGSAIENDESFGVFGGRDMTTRPGRKKGLREVRFFEGRFRTTQGICQTLPASRFKPQLVVATRLTYRRPPEPLQIRDRW